MHNGTEHPICYSSRTLNAAERRYSTIERECLAVVYAIKTYRVYLTGTHFTIMTDHRPLKYLLTIKDPSSRLSKWAMFLMEYSFTIQYRPGRMNGNVDSLTRLRQNESETKATNIKQIALVNENPPIKPLHLVVWTQQEIKNLQDQDPYVQDLVSKLDTQHLFYQNPLGLLYKERQNEERHDQLVAPALIIPDILRMYHSSLFGAHPGQKKTCQLIQQDFFWKTLRTDVKSYIERCHSCNTRKSNFQPPVEMQKMPVPSTAWERIAMDIVGPLNQTENGNKYILTCVDFLTRYPECIPIPDIKANTVARAFVENIIVRHGAPRELLTDCGTQFVGKIFQNICNILEIKKLQTTPYHPAGNGIVERMHKTLKTMISHFTSEHQYNWDETLPFALLAYRNQIHEATKETPFYLMFGRDMELPVHLTIRDKKVRYDMDDYGNQLIGKLQHAHHQAQRNIEKSIEKRCEKHNSRRLRRSYTIGDLVYLKLPSLPGKNLARKFLPKWKGLYRILEKKGPVTFKIKEVNGKKVQMVHADRLKLFKGEQDLERVQENLTDNELQDDQVDHDEFVETGVEPSPTIADSDNIPPSSSTTLTDNQNENGSTTENEDPVVNETLSERLDVPTVEDNDTILPSSSATLREGQTEDGDIAEKEVPADKQTLSESLDENLENDDSLLETESHKNPCQNEDSPIPEVSCNRTTRTRQVKMPLRFKDYKLD